MASSPISISTATGSSAPDRPPLTEQIARNERRVILGSIALLGVLAWGWTLLGAGLTSGRQMAGMAPAVSAGIPLVLTMWWVMMAAMMLPSTAPAILLYGRVRHERRDGAMIARSWIFLSGYLLAWLGVAAAATALQLLATRAGLLDAMALRATSPRLAGATLIATGLYQLSPLKNACLVNCRSPAGVLSRHWQPGAKGALRLGLLHGGYCIGCCWLLMALLFVGGVMNFLWIAALTALVAVEKLVRSGPAIARLSGILLILWGAIRLLGV